MKREAGGQDEFSGEFSVGLRSARRGHAGRVKSGRVVHRCIRSACRRPACRSRRCVGLCIVVVAVLAAGADAVLVAHQVHPATIAGNPKARGKTTARLPRARSAWTV